MTLNSPSEGEKRQEKVFASLTSYASLRSLSRAIALLLSCFRCSNSYL